MARDTREGYRYYLGYRPVDESGISDTNDQKLTHDFLMRLSPEAAAQYMNAISSIIGTPWFLLSRKEELQMAEFVAERKRRGQPLHPDSGASFPSLHPSDQKSAFQSQANTTITNEKKVQGSRKEKARNPYAPKPRKLR